ncbi:PKD domain-containing protein, partial [archaeon]|nr:PKD domain-containing protein [archaeon]
NRALNPDATMSYYRDYVGDNIANILTSGLANEFCVLDLNGKVIVGLSLNKEVNETSAEGGCVPCGWSALREGACVDGCLVGGEGSAPKSFLQVMKGSNKNTYCDSVIDNKDGAYHACEGTDVYYNAKLKNVIFTKMHQLPNDDRQVVPLTTTVSFIDRIIEAIRSVFRNLLNIAGLVNPQLESAYKSQLDFVARAGSFNKLYLSFSPEGPVSGEPRTINAVRETRASLFEGTVSIRTFISAEYHNYQTDICNFFYKHNYPYLRAQISKQPGIQCTPVILDEDNWMYSVYVEQPFFADIEDTTDIRSVQVWLGDSDSFWNDITAAIRTQTPPPYGDDLPDTPTFDLTPVDPVIGTKVNFSFTLPAEQARDIIAMTWDFGDDNKASSAYNITTLHKYAESKTGGYDVYVWIMDSNFRIRKSDPKHVDVALAASVGITEEWPQSTADLRDGNISVSFTITGGNTPFSGVDIAWGDDTFTEVGELSGTSFTQEHQYDFPGLALGYNQVKHNVTVSGFDRDDVPFSQTKEITISHS